MDIIDEVDEDIDLLIEELDKDTFYIQYKIITYILSKYATFLNNFLGSYLTTS